MKNITLLLVLLLLSSYSFSQEITDYLSGLNNPTKMIIDGTTIYVNGWEDIYTIDTSSGSPSANLIYTLPNDFYAYKTEKLGNNLFILVENYIEATDDFFGSRILKLDLTDIASGTQTVVSTPRFISSFTLTGNTIYYSEEDQTAPDVYTTDIYSFDATQNSPTPSLIRDDIGLDSDAVNDMEVYNNSLYISSGHAEKILKLDLSSNSLEDYLSNPDISFNKGINISAAGDLYICNAHNLVKIDLNNPGASLQHIGENTTYFDDEGSGPFNANFRDVVLIGNTAYLTLENQGRIVTLSDATLSISKLSNDALKIYPNPVTSNLYLGNNIDFKEFELFDITGKKVLYGTIKFNSINFNGVETGIYILNLKSEDSQNNFRVLKK